MPKISIRQDERGGRTVYSGRTALMGGLAEDEAQNFATFFRAADRFEGARRGRVQARGKRSGTFTRPPDSGL